MDELVRQGAVQIRQRRRQIAALRAELAKLAQRNASEKTVNRAELMGSAWHRLQNAIYMLALLERAMLRLRKQIRAHAPSPISAGYRSNHIFSRQRPHACYPAPLI